MIEKQTSKNDFEVTFKSLNEFYKYICETPFNEAFRWESHSSVDGDEYFTKTKNFEEATELFKKGWSDGSKKLNSKIKVENRSLAPISKRKTTLGIAGYQAIVPLYLNGCPNNMVSTKNVVMKQKVLTINKDISYNCGYSAERIMEYSVKCLQIVEQLERQGYRVNLNIVFGAKAGGRSVTTKIRIKNANEKLNVSKMAFPLVHPSMLRRLIFRFEETYPKFTKSFVHGYGAAMEVETLRNVCKDEIFIPRRIDMEPDEIKDIEMLNRI